MHLATSSGSGPTQHATAKELFDIVWRSLSDVIGPAATASVLRRSVRRAVALGGDFEGLAIERHGFTHHYVLPGHWGEPGRAAVDALRLLLAELAVILRTLTGPVLVRRLASHPELERAALFTPSESM